MVLRRWLWPGRGLAALAFGLGAAVALGQVPLGLQVLALPALCGLLHLLSREAAASRAFALALFAGAGHFGLALRRYGLQADVKLTATIAALKLFVHPAAVYVLAHKVFTMPPVWSGVAVLFAAMPSGVNAYLFAERYRTGVALSSSAIATFER